MGRQGGRGQHYSEFSGGLTLGRDWCKIRKWKGKGEPVYDPCGLDPRRIILRKDKIRKAKGIKRFDKRSIEIGGYGGAGCCHMISKPAGLPGGHQLLRHSNINNLGFFLRHPRYFCIIHLVLSCESGRSNLVLRPWSPPSSPHNPSDFAPPADLLAKYPESCTVRFTFGLLSAFDQSLGSCSKVMSVFHLKDLIGHDTKSPLPKYFVDNADFCFAQQV